MCFLPEYRQEHEAVFENAPQPGCQGVPGHRSAVLTRTRSQKRPNFAIVHPPTEPYAARSVIFPALPTSGYPERCDWRLLEAGAVEMALSGCTKPRTGARWMGDIRSPSQNLD